MRVSAEILNEGFLKPAPSDGKRAREGAQPGHGDSEG
jgi:hypothetical protein